MILGSGENFAWSAHGGDLRAEYPKRRGCSISLCNFEFDADRLLIAFLTLFICFEKDFHTDKEKFRIPGVGDYSSVWVIHAIENSKILLFVVIRKGAICYHKKIFYTMLLETYL